MKAVPSQLREWQASWRDTILLLRRFRGALLIFAVAMVGGGIIYYEVSRVVGEGIESLPESIYLMLTLAFLQPNGSFPHSPWLQIFYFIFPLIGIGTLAQGLADFGIALFNRRARSREWEIAVASTYENHIILVGLGHLGYRVIQKLHEMDEKIVVIDLNPVGDMASSVKEMGVPVLQDDAVRPASLEEAGVRKARTIMLCSQNDSQNLQIAVKARSMNPKIQVVIRIFDEDFAQSLQEQFGFTALSATIMAAPVFAAAAAGADVTNPISIEGQQLSLARLVISPDATFAGRTVGFVEDNLHLNIVLVRHDHHSEMHPTDATLLSAGDVLAVLGGPEQLSHLMRANEGVEDTSLRKKKR
jgi:Trk K+ transport system NAD-binding subunit